jgi:protein SCO1/2
MSSSTVGRRGSAAASVSGNEVRRARLWDNRVIPRFRYVSSFPNDMPARPLLTGVVLIVAFALGLFAAQHWFRSSAPELPLSHATLYPQPKSLVGLGLTDQHGAALTAESLRGRWWLVFFGFTQCPDVCPTTLATLARTKTALADLPAAEQPRVLLISVDSERDTPERLAAYVQYFDPDFVGATGSPEAVTQAAGLFGVPFAKVGLPSGGYTFDHGAGVFIVNPDAAIAAYSSAPHDAAVLAADYRVLAERGAR